MKIKEESPSPNIQYIGKGRVKLNGAGGWIQTGQALYLPEEMVCNLVLDKENWVRIQTRADSPPVEKFVEVDDSPQEEKKRRKKEVS